MASGVTAAPTQTLFGYVVDTTGSYWLNLAILGWAPMVGLLAFLILWRSPQSAAETPPDVAPAAA